MGKIATLFLIPLILIGIFFGYRESKTERIMAGEACLVLHHGKVDRVAGPGRVFEPAWGTSFSCWETLWQSGEVGEHDSQSDFSRGSLAFETSDGVTVNLTAQVRYRTPMESLETLYTEGARSQQSAWDKIVEKEVSNAMREVTIRTPVRDIYLDGRAIADEEMGKILSDRLALFGIETNYFSLTSVTPPEDYRSNIALQQQEAENAEKKKAETETARQEAERKKAEAQGEADAAIILAQGEAESNRIVSESLTPEILALEMIRALPTAQWAIFSPDDLQPMTTIETPEATPAP